MSYCSLQDLIDRYGETELIQLTDKTGSGVVDQAAVDRVIADVDGEIDAYLAKRMTLPMATVPPVLVRFSCVMVRYYLYTDVVPELQEKQYQAAVNFLKAIANGTASLGVDDVGDAQPENPAPSYVQGESVFSGGGLDDY